MKITLVDENTASPLEPDWEKLESWQGVPFRGITAALLHDIGPGRAVLNHFEPAAEAPAHSADEFAFIQVVRGRGTMKMPDGTAVRYDGPHLFLFQPGAKHSWVDVEEETLLSICLVATG